MVIYVILMVCSIMPTTYLNSHKFVLLLVSLDCHWGHERRKFQSVMWNKKLLLIGYSLVG